MRHSKNASPLIKREWNWGKLSGKKTFRYNICGKTTPVLVQYAMEKVVNRSLVKYKWIKDVICDGGCLTVVTSYFVGERTLRTTLVKELNDILPLFSIEEIYDDNETPELMIPSVVQIKTLNTYLNTLLVNLK